MEQIIKIENLIKSGQDIFNECKGDFKYKTTCYLDREYKGFRCCYKVDSNCTYPLPLLHRAVMYKPDENIGDC